MTVRITPLATILAAILIAQLRSVPLSPSNSGCSVNGTLYGEGSALVAQSNCEYCYCIRGKEQCVRPHCVLKVPGCNPEYNQHSCCPVKYNCSELKNDSATSTTTAASLINKSGSSCKVNGTLYPEGERIDGAGKQCENCYCMKGEVRCEPIICSIPVEGCRPITAPGHCCPTSYNCSNTELTTTEISKDVDGSTETPNTTIIDTDKSETESSTLEETTEASTFESPQNDTELRSGTENGIVGEDTTTFQPVTLEITTTTETSSLPDNNSSSPVRSIPDVIEAIINRTLAKDDDYDYDYNESSLPPSLPNLKIIPFVAADAVVNDQDGYSGRLEGKTEIPIYLDIPQPNRFSPPSKTEGGFVPRDPVIDGPFYESKFEKPFSSNEPQVEFTSETLLPPITEPPKLFEEGKCNSEGRTYHHGEVVSEPNACELCVCYYRQVHCQKPKCNPIKAGCTRVHDEKTGCCGREVCGNNVENLSGESSIMETASLSTPLPESMSNIPAITVADLIVTPDPFKDVIRTEPAPDLEDIMKDMLPHLMNESSELKTVTPDFNSGLQNSTVPNYSTTNNGSLNKNSTKNSQGLGHKANITSSLNKTDHIHPIQDGNRRNSSSDIQSDFNDSFSFSSVLDMLFRGGSSESDSTKIIVPTSTTSETPTANNVYNIHVTEQKHDINNAIENSDSDYNSQNDKKTEKTNELSIFNDYQADESRNDTKEEIESHDSIKPNQSISKAAANSTVMSDNKTIKDDIASGLLKLAGCNIYGRMYRVGRIISELSGPCLECMCTEFGVQCRKLC